jgi:uncharacterized protein (TIGR04255 family)
MAEQDKSLPTFDNPPVIETIIGAQFVPLLDFTSAHFGWYWKQYLDSSWVKTLEAPALPDQFEKFGEQKSGGGVPQFQFQTIAEPDRLQIISDKDDRVIQIQRSRFIYNWRKREGGYPTFKRTYPEFLKAFSLFRRFASEASLGEVAVNQWEVTYVNHIPKGTLWESPSDWPKIFPKLFPSVFVNNELEFEGLGSQWRFEITPAKGRLHAVINHAKLEEGGDERLVLQLTARGPVQSKKEGLDLESGITLGHRVVVCAFADMASPAARSHWKMR